MVQTKIIRIHEKQSNITNTITEKKKVILQTSVFTEEINKIALNSNDDKRIPSVDSIETSETRKDVVSEKKRLNVTI